jgi:hypothetical protein
MLGTAMLNASGAATLTITPALGNYSIITSYAGDGDNASSDSPAVPVNVVAIGSTGLTLNVSATTLTYGQTLTLTGTASGSISGHAPTGSVSFTSAGTTLGTSTLNASDVAAYSFAPSAGTYSIGVSYGGDAFNAAATASPVSVTVNPAATALTLSSNLNPAPPGAAIQFTVLVQSSAGMPSGSVTLMDGTTVLSVLTLNTGTATYSSSTLAIGTHNLTATYAAGGNYAASQAALSQIVLAPPTFSVAPGGPLTLVTQQQGPVTITVTPLNGFSGDVTLSCGPLPEYATCEWGTSLLTSTTLAVSGRPASTQLQIDTSAVLGYEASRRPVPGASGSRFALAGLAVPAVWLLWRRRRGTIRPLICLLVLFAGLALSGCSSKYPGSTPPGTYTVTILASSGNIQNTGILTLVVTN